ncbi:hypothetical protein [Streptomyces sp. cg40]|uniref:hypothetical protein n=1 Tax=Streptomyces sp. cg40 TaxID=3419764 RepID=UPI003D029D83
MLAVAAFFLLAKLWALSFEHGYAGVLPSRAGLPLHCFVSGCLAALGAAAGQLDTLPDATRWLLCSSSAGYFLLSGLAWLGKAHRNGSGCCRWRSPAAYCPCCWRRSAPMCAR